MKERLLFCLMLLAMSMQAQPNLNIDLLSNVEVGEAGNDIWGYVDKSGIEYAIMGSQTATRIFSLEDPTNPIERAVISGASSIWRDIKHYDEYLYVTTDQGQDGLLIVDMRGAPEVIEFKFWQPMLDVGTGPEQINACHNLYVDAELGWCYLAGCNMGAGGVVILDIHTDPWEPMMVGATNEFYSHDVFAHGDILYSSEISAGHFSVYDITDRTNPQRTILQNTTSNFTHNAWASDDGQYLFTTDERPNAFLDAYDISDPTDVKLLDAYQPLETVDRGVIPHNTHYLDGLLYTSWYTDGVVVVDGTKPDNLIKVAAYDTYLGGDGGFSGCWGTYPFLPSGNLLVSDINSGLYVFGINKQRACYLEGKVVSKETGLAINMAEVQIQADQMAFGQSDASGEFKTGLATAGSYTVSARHPDYIATEVVAELENGVVTEITIEMEPLVSFVFSGSVVRDADGNPIENASVIAISQDREIQATTDAIGNFSMNLFDENYTIYAGAWGYNEIESSFLGASGGTLELRLKQGYKDDFVIDQGWTESGNAQTGKWERGEPIGTFGQGPNAVNPASDNGTDLGRSAYMTGNAGGGQGDDDVDDGTTTLTSLPMDLSGMSQPVISFDYWFVNFGGFGGPPNDQLRVELHDGTSGIIVASFDDNNPTWQSYSLNVKDFFEDVSNISVIFETSDFDDSGHIVEAAIDVFLVSEGDPNSVKDLEEVQVSISPNPFIETVNISMENAGFERVRITTSTGIVVTEESFNGTNKTLSTEAWAPGIYFVELLKKDQRSKAIKMIKM